MFNEDNGQNSMLSKIEQLRLAIADQKIKIIKKLLLEVDLREKYNGKTLLHMACLYKTSHEVFEILIREFKKKNVSLDVVDNKNLTALDYAFVEANHIAIEVLIKAGADYKRYWLSDLNEETYLNYFLEKNPTEQVKINGFILQKENALQADTQEESQEPEAQSTEEKFTTVRAEETTNKTSFFNFMGGFFHQFRGYIKLQNSGDNATINNIKNLSKISKKHFKDD